MKKLCKSTIPVALLASLFMTFFVAGCATTTEQPKAGIMGEKAPLPHSGFLGDYSQLKPGKEGQAALVYLNPAAQWSKYNKIIIEPVQFWAAPDTQVPPSDQEVLASYFYNALKENLQKHFTLVDKPGPDVMKLQTALTDATASTPVLRSASVVIPQVRVLNTAQSLATGSYAFVGTAQAEGQIIDSRTGERLAAAVDKRAGGMGLKAAAQWKWGDAQNAMDYWAQRIAQRIVELQTQGKTSD